LAETNSLGGKMKTAYDCGGHVKHHLQTALGRQLQLTVLSSALSSEGQKPCKFSFAIVDPEPAPGEA
jgi:hypothetical protein